MQRRRVSGEGDFLISHGRTGHNHSLCGACLCGIQSVVSVVGFCYQNTTL